MIARTASLCVEALPREDLARIRERGVDDFGNPAEVTVAESGGAPLRCCLREATEGERIMLIAYQPARAVGGPYAEVGPIFIHAEACDGYAAPHSYPDGFRHRRQLLRAYSPDGHIVDAVIAEHGAEAEDVCAAFLAQSGIAYIHSRNVLFGCYMFTVRRPE